MLLRHGESTANEAGTFAGLLDVPLTPHGEQQASAAGRRLRSEHITLDVVVTSTLRRAVRTAELVCDALETQLPTEAVWQLNERNYGALTGMTKTDARQTLGDDEYMRLRRSRTGTPPPMSLLLWEELRSSSALRGLPNGGLRRTEALSDVIEGVRPVLYDRLLPMVRAGRSVLVVAHGNSLRALCACIDDLTDSELERLNLPTGQPVQYHLAATGVLVPRGGAFLDPVAAQLVAALVAAEGGT
ncbi:2,3-diphosphoglycerate-dependent phosphoglycerate mutase [Curtobacterium sp. A7_M15]|uniref:2,3-diphosphoglycerate-dependent phosphoglycerate mutase n=1 Tax=Curtobacterium sp. A7_M15 TaxID=3065241 RepID=UPI0027379787|nr:2,3-diphosphoglycerate-dependent phosphoglycerate mutase [Curtobacterium sp. A7_M15]MDP4332414.1 2,3-diphosphoglycerate-dependent phosphoglycerate mutase [Curtobacterium sp. A7_M15]